MKVLIDTDIYRYQMGSVMMKHPYAGHGDVPYDAKVPASSEFVCYLVDESIKEVLKATGADEYICALSGVGNFRLDVADQQKYKGNRNPNVTRPYHYDTVGSHIIANHPHVVVDGIEADDWLGITQRADPDNTVIASRDKDLQCVHGWHYRFACGEAQPPVPLHWITESDAIRFFFYQMLIGDNTDNIPGCGVRIWQKWGIAHEVTFPGGKVVKIPKMVLRRKGVGEKTAKKLLGEETDPQKLYEIVSEEYKKVFGDDWKTVIIEQARLLYIGQTPENLFDWSWLNITEENKND